MINIYDIINDLYTDDEGWNQVLRREYAEQFLRTEAFRGASDDDLLDIWGQVMYLLIYCGNTGCKIGDMTSEDLIYCISWCQRNIADFEVNYDSVEQLLSVIHRLLVFLKHKKAITDDDAALRCKAKLLGADKKLNLFNSDGSLPDEYEKYRTNREPDLDTKIFMQMGKKLTDLFYLMKNYFNDDSFRYERKRARLSYFGSDSEPDFEKRPEIEASFWEFFLFDFHLSDTNQRPVEAFYEYYKSHPDPDYEKSNKALTVLLESMQKVRLMVFTIEGEDEDGWYLCRDFFTGSISELSLPLDDNIDTGNLLCLAHVFEDGNLITEYLWSVYVKPLARKALLKRFSSLLEWYRVSEPGADWENFCENNAALITHMVGYAGMQDTILEPFRWSTKIRNYKPSLIKEDDPVHQFIIRFSRLLHISWKDRKNLLQMWSDFYTEHPVSFFSTDEYIVWALAILGSYMTLTETYLLDIVSYAEKTKIEGWRIHDRMQIIRTALNLEHFDPRYCSESSFMNMMFS
ncbi:MAG: hypothetical protein J6M57_04430 [Acidaminococcaceae bacterium]|nr:hypothetical protein [Acidaminococcaceae bacterium]